MKTSHWIYWIAIMGICVIAWLALPIFGTVLSELLGGKPWPLITQWVLYWRSVVLAPPILAAAAAIWLTRTDDASIEASRFISQSAPLVVASLGLVCLAVILPFGMTNGMVGGRQIYRWDWLFTGHW